MEVESVPMQKTDRAHEQGHEQGHGQSVSSKGLQRRGAQGLRSEEKDLHVLWGHSARQQAADSQSREEPSGCLSILTVPGPLPHPQPQQPGQTDGRADTQLCLWVPGEGVLPSPWFDSAPRRSRTRTGLHRVFARSLSHSGSVGLSRGWRQEGPRALSGGASQL